MSRHREARLCLSDAEHRAIDREDRPPTARETRARADDLVDRIIDLEDRLYIQQVLLESALELLDRRAVEIHSLRTLIRMDVAMKAMEREIASGRHLQVAA